MFFHLCPRFLTNFLGPQGPLVEPWTRPHVRKNLSFIFPFSDYLLPDFFYSPNIFTLLRNCFSSPNIVLLFLLCYLLLCKKLYSFSGYFPPSPFFISSNGKIFSFFMISYSFIFSFAEKIYIPFSNVFLRRPFLGIKNPISPVILSHITYHLTDLYSPICSSFTLWY